MCLEETPLGSFALTGNSGPVITAPLLTCLHGPDRHMPSQKGDEQTALVIHHDVKLLDEM